MGQAGSTFICKAASVHLKRTERVITPLSTPMHFSYRCYRLGSDPITDRGRAYDQKHMGVSSVSRGEALFPGLCTGQ